MLVGILWNLWVLQGDFVYVGQQLNHGFRAASSER